MARELGDLQAGCSCGDENYAMLFLRHKHFLFTSRFPHGSLHQFIARGDPSRPPCPAARGKRPRAMSDGLGGGRAGSRG